MKRDKLFLLLGVVALLSTSGTLLVWSVMNTGPTPTDTARVPYLFYVNSTSGFDLDKDIFRLGAVTRGGASSRGLQVSHDSAQSAAVIFRGSGEEWMSAEPPVVALEDGVVNVTIRVSVPPEAPMGRYAGEIILVFFDIPVSINDDFNNS